MFLLRQDGMTRGCPRDALIDTVRLKADTTGTTGVDCGSVRL
jgi:hypothetical protein